MIRFEVKDNPISMTVERTASTGDDYNRGYEAGLADGYNDGKEAGYNDGYTKGKSDGETIGYERGHIDGRIEGISVGYAEGKVDGETIGYERGYAEGYAKGKTDGYAEGYNIGLDEGRMQGRQAEAMIRDEQEAKYLSDINKRVNYYGVSESETLSNVPKTVDDVYAKGGRDGYANGLEDGEFRGREAGVKEGKQAEYDRFWDAYQQDGDRTNYAGAFAGRGWTAETFTPKYKIVPNGTIVADYMFYQFNRTSTSSADDLVDFAGFNEMLDLSNCGRLNYTFQDARIKNLFVDASSATSMTSAFNGGNGGYINNLTLKVTSKTTTFTSTFASQSRMTEIRFTEDSEICATINFNWSPLTVESMKSIIKALKDFSGTASEFTKTIQFSSACWETLNAEGATSPNGNTWSEYVTNLGWNAT